jgi:hypothetical protein
MYKAMATSLLRFRRYDDIYQNRWPGSMHRRGRGSSMRFMALGTAKYPLEALHNESGY